MAKDFAKLADDVTDSARLLRRAAPELMAAYGAVGRAVYSDGALDGRTKELAALALAVAGHCEGCIAWHARRAAELGASREEVVEIISVAIHMGGGPGMVSGGEALKAFDAFAPMTIAAE